MTVYAKKNARGQPTGQWVVEVTKGGKRARHVSRSLEEAQEAERALLAMSIPDFIRSLSTGSAGAPTAILTGATSYLVADLRRDAAIVWRGTKDEDRSVMRFDAVCDILGDDTPLVTVRTSQLDHVVSVLRSRSLSNKTIHRYLAAFSGALKWATMRDKIMGRPIIPWPECGKGNSTVISESDERRVLGHLQKVGSPDVALVVDVLLATGCRVGELLALTPDDIGNDSVTFRDTKNDDDRTVPLEESLATRLKALSHVGFPTYRRINQSLHSASRTLKINHKVTPHVFRHTVGTRLSDAGVEVPTIGLILGHRNVRTTMGYIHPQKAAVRKAVDVLRRNREDA